MASLIMLSTITAAIPMSNMNFFSDATTSGKHSDKNDNYKEFERYYSDDESNYRANYDDNF